MNRPRLGLRYGDAHAPAKVVDGIDPDVPIAGFYRFKLVTGGMPVAVHLWFGSPIEPWTGEEMDRGPRWNATVNGRWTDVEKVWPRCAKEPIDEAEAKYLTSLQEWGEKNAPHSPQANPRQKINLLTAPIDL